MSALHSREGSGDSTQSGASGASVVSNNSSYQMVFEQIMQYPGSYELPLRTMHALNTIPRAQLLPRKVSTGGSSSEMVWSETSAATASFTNHLLEQIQSLPAQPTSLPPSFIVSFVSRCLHPQLALVDFSQGLVALDYLKDLENRRCRDVVSCWERLRMNPDNVAEEAQEFDKYPVLADFIQKLHFKDKRAEHHYASLYVGVRRWLMITELQALPFNKFNCLGMLNTLYPPQRPGVDMKAPSPLLRPENLKTERDQFFTYIKRVEKNGTGMLKNIIDAGRRPGESDGWRSVQEHIEKYLKLTQSILADHEQLMGMDDLPNLKDVKRRNVKKDSGISFGIPRPSTGGTDGTSDHMSFTQTEPKTPSKGRTRLQKIARDLKWLRMGPRPTVEEIVKLNKDPHDSHSVYGGDTDKKEKKPEKKVKKSRSMAALIGGNKSAHSSSTTLVPARKPSTEEEFDVEQMRRHRLEYEASAGRSNPTRSIV